MSQSLESTDPRQTEHTRCDGVPDLGPAHCHLCSEMRGRDEVSPGPHCPTRAVEAAKVAFEVAAGYEHAAPVVLHAGEFADVHGAVSAALQACAEQMPELPRHTVPIAASHSIRGAHAELDGVTFPSAAGLTTAVITIRTAHPIDRLTLILVISQISHEVESAAEEQDDAYVAEKIYIIEEGPRA
ncbi:hypothetical protein QCN29_14885 [Streptomyces sp. HNM0663]|uniref:Uncharacterized protein n=1 Tax=Streptomyces chengmaiensis TaxID=3040919 RepID=A0ABT6HMZ2_9ACTN|nr:hypothetical protein [Streptomyces chengmaiensis]MDH2390053.1 hypothetical protein [Streptomyces chengmaiensis]